MNRLLILSFLFLPFLSSSQSYGLCMQVLASNGGTGEQGGYKVSWTVGEVVIATGTGMGYKITQGFHQPDVCMPVSTSNLDLQALGLEVFPNPTTDLLTVQYTDADNITLMVTAFDMLGNQVMTTIPLDAPEGTTLDASSWPPGVYFLHFTDNETRSSAAVKIVRL